MARMANEDFCLKWNDHHSVFFSLAEELHQQGVLTDVILATDSRTFSAHRLVLSVCSVFFRNLFSRPEFIQPSQGGHFIYLKDVSPHHLEMLLSYMYRGEINCEETELLNFISTARGLGVKGLSEVEEGGDKQALGPSARKNRVGGGKRKREDGAEVIKIEKEEVEDVEPQVVEPQIESMLLDQDGEDNWFENMGYRGDLEDGQAEDKKTEGGENLDCSQCPKSFTSTWHLKRHVATHTKQKRCRCEYCGKLFSRNDNLKSHQKSVHGFMFAPGSSEVLTEGNGDILAASVPLAETLYQHQSETVE